MRSSLAKIPYRATTATSSISAAFFSSAGGGGRGRGRGSPFQFTVDASVDNQTDNSKTDGEPPQPYGHGRGRGTPLPSSPVIPSFSSLVNNDTKVPPLGRGRGAIPTKPTLPKPAEESALPSENPPKPNVKLPFLFAKDEESQEDADESEVPAAQEKVLKNDIVNVLSGAGRGKPIQPPAAQPEKPKTENRHIRQPPQGKSPAAAVDKSSPREQLSQEEKVKKAVSILSKGDPEAGRGTTADRGGRGARGRGRGRGRGERYGGRGRGDDRYEESDDEEGGLYIGDPADGEKVAEKFGPVIMDKLAEGVEEMASRVLPSPLDDAFIDAFETNLRVIMVDGFIFVGLAI